MDEVEIVVGRRRGPRWRQVTYGVHRSVPMAGRRGPDLEARQVTRADRHLDLLAWQSILPPEACFTHLTAAAVLGLWLPPLPAGLPVHVTIPKSVERPRRSGLRVSRLTPAVEPVVVRGLRLAPVPEVLLACARDLGMLDLVVLSDSALGSGECIKEELVRVAAPRRRGSPALRTAVEVADARAESPWETLLRLLHVLCDVPVEPQHEVLDGKGGFVARGDLWICGTRTLHEYDGAVHRDRRTHVNDLARDRRLVNAGWTRRGYTSIDLLARPQDILREADAALGRRHDPRRLRPWREALAESAFTRVGQKRLVDRCLGTA